MIVLILVSELFVMSVCFSFALPLLSLLLYVIAFGFASFNLLDVFSLLSAHCYYCIVFRACFL